MEHMENESARVASLSDEITKMVKEDQDMRMGAQRGEREFDRQIDYKNTARLKEIISETGWPNISKFGEDTSHKTWLLVQHADHDTNFQEECLELMKRLPEGEVSKENIAFLEDRVRVNTGRPQIYGTQWHLDSEGVYGPEPIEDISKLTELWTEMGSKVYPSYEVYRDRMLEGHGPLGKRLKPDRN